MNLSGHGDEDGYCHIHGVLAEFYEDTESIKNYVERAKIFFLANSISED